MTKLGGWGEAWGGGPWSAGKGHQRAVKNLTTGLIWLVTRVGRRGEAWGGGPWRAAKGERGGAPESSAKGALVPPLSDLAGDEGGGMGGGVGRWGGVGGGP